MNQRPLDLTLFRWIESQTSDRDREALLSITEAVCGISGGYRYLEVGSHLGGSLQPHVLDNRCVKIFSIDPRPVEQPDERWTTNYKYEGNSTARMLDLLGAIPGANIQKIQTFEACSWDLSAGSIAEPVEFAFIDGEHTNAAVVRDFIAVRRFLAPAAVLAFHDSFVTPAALLKIVGMLRGERRSHRTFYFPHSNVVAIAFDGTGLNEALRSFGWEEGLPFSHWDSFKQFLKRRMPWIGRAGKGRSADT
jgi:hypothetical protein